MNSAIDPVCGMTVDPALAAGKYEYKGTTYYFCAKSCEQRFAADPERFLNKTAKPTPVSAGLVMIGAPKNLLQIINTAPPVATVIDPVCGMSVDPARAAGKLDYRG